MFESIATWVSGADPNKERRHAEQAQQDQYDKQTVAANAFARDTYNAERETYQKQRDYAYETSVTNWEYGKKIQDYQYAKSLASYEKSQNIYNSQLSYNKQASALAVNDQQAVIQDLLLSQAFQREGMHIDLMTQIKSGGFDIKTQIQAGGSDLLTQTKSGALDLLTQTKSGALDLMTQTKAGGADLITQMKSAGIGKLEQGAQLYGIKSGRRIGTELVQQNLNQFTAQNTFEKEARFVESLQKSGKAALGQAGVSRKKTLQSTAAESFRSLVALDSSLSGARNKAAVDLLKLQVDASIAETQVGLTLDKIDLGVTSAKDKYEFGIGAAQKRYQFGIDAAEERYGFDIGASEDKYKFGIGVAKEKYAFNIDVANKEIEFNNRVLEANMQSAIGQMERNIQQINLQKFGADLQAEADLNLFPEKFDYAPEPQMTPERIFVEPVEQVPYQVPKGPRVATGVEAAVNIFGEVGEAASMAIGGIGTFNKVFPNFFGN